MTNDEIGKLEGRELDAALMTAFGVLWRPYHKSVDAVLAALPDEWNILLDNYTQKPSWSARIIKAGSTSCCWGHGPTPATPLCRAALMAKEAG